MEACAGMDGKCLASSGKEVLIKSVVQALPTYSMSLFKLPRGLCEHIAVLIWKFWWGSRAGQRKTAWVSWETMCMPKYKGGLGFRDMEIFNLALLARQAWRLLQDPSSLSARILKSVYYPNSDILAAEVGSRPSQIWRSICEGRDILKTGLIKRIGDGEDTNIWNDNWLPRSYNMRPVSTISANPPTLVSELISHATRTWNEESLQNHLLPMDAEIVRQIPISYKQQKDFVAWQYETRGVFSVRSCYRLVVETKFRRENWLNGSSGSSDLEQQERQWKMLWGVKVPTKLRIFAWRLARASLPTGQEQKRRHMTDEEVCPIAELQWTHGGMLCWTAICQSAFGHCETMTRCFLFMAMRRPTPSCGCLTFAEHSARTNSSRS